MAHRFSTIARATSKSVGLKKSTRWWWWWWWPTLTENLTKGKSPDGKFVAEKSVQRLEEPNSERQLNVRHRMAGSFFKAAADVNLQWVYSLQSLLWIIQILTHRFMFRLAYNQRPGCDALYPIFPPGPLESSYYLRNALTFNSLRQRIGNVSRSSWNSSLSFSSSSSSLLIKDEYKEEDALIPATEQQTAEEEAISCVDLCHLEKARSLAAATTTTTTTTSQKLTIKIKERKKRRRRRRRTGYAATPIDARRAQLVRPVGRD